MCQTYSRGNGGAPRVKSMAGISTKSSNASPPCSSEDKPDNTEGDQNANNTGYRQAKTNRVLVVRALSQGLSFSLLAESNERGFRGRVTTLLGGLELAEGLDLGMGTLCHDTEEYS